MKKIRVRFKRNEIADGRHVNEIIVNDRKVWLVFSNAKWCTGLLFWCPKVFITLAHVKLAEPEYGVTDTGISIHLCIGKKEWDYKLYRLLGR